MSRTLGDKIRDARKVSGLTQKELAEKVNVGNTTISNWEKGVSRPDADQIQVLCWALGVEPNYFLGGSASGSEPIALDDFTFAMHNHSGNLTDKDKEILLSMAQQLADAHRKKDAVGDSE